MDEQNNKPRIHIACNLARKLLSDVGIKNPPVLIKDIINHIKKERDLSVYSWAFGKDTDGMQITEGEKTTIGYNQTQHLHRQRFTVAHEIGHLILGHTAKNFNSDLNSNKPKEVEANNFASELLMPLNFLKGDCSKGYNLQSIAERYIVSEEAICRKLMSTNLLKKL